ncbi:MAG: PDZ domain-containing protein [Lachnospiraceae bacterium]
MAAGPLFNFILAFVISVVVVGMTGYSLPTVTAVTAGSAAEKAGLKEGDLITSFDGYGTLITNDLYTYLSIEGVSTKEVEVKVKRDGERLTLRYTPDSQVRYMLGFTYYQDENEAQIGSVILNGAMYKAGLQAGDVICEINGTVINSGAELQAYMQEHPLDGSEIEISYVREVK